MTTPTVQVLQDDGTGTFPNDITQYVEAGETLTWSRGRPDEFGTVEPGQLGFTLTNTDNRFGIGGANRITLNQKMRVIVNGLNRFTGRVQSAPPAWPGGGQLYSTLDVTLVDDLARFAGVTFRSAIEEDITVSGPVASYPLSEAAGATLAGDTSGNVMPSLAIAGTGAAMTFASGIGPTDGLACATFFGGKFLRNTIPAVYLPASSAWTVECYFTTTTTPASFAPMVMVGDASGGQFAMLSISSAGKLSGSATIGFNLSSAATVTDGLVHHAALTLTAGGVLTLYLDGVNVGSGGSVPLLTADAATFSVAPSDTGLFAAFIGTVAHATVYTTALSSGVIGTRGSAGNDYVGERPAARIARIAGYLQTSTSGLDNTGTTLLGPANQTGRNAVDILFETSDADLGIVYVNGSGAITSANGNSVAIATNAPDAIIDAMWADEGTSYEFDMANVVNSATGHATGSANQAAAKNPASIAIHGLYGVDYEWNVSTDSAAADRVNWKVNVNKLPTPRLPSVTFDVLSMDSTNVTAMLLLDLFSWLRLNNIPSQSPESTTFSELIVQGISETVSIDEWTITITGTRRDLYHAWVLGNGFAGVLDQSTILYV